MGDKVGWIVTAGLAFGIAWYSGILDGILDFRTPEEKRHQKWCGLFVRVEAIDKEEIETCVNEREAFISAATTAAKLEAERDARRISQVASYLEERAETINLEIFKPYTPVDQYPPLYDNGEDDVEPEQYNRRYIDIVRLDADYLNDDGRIEFSISGVRKGDKSGSSFTSLPRLAGDWKEVLYLLDGVCPFVMNAEFEGCQARIFIEAVYRRNLGQEPATTFMLLKPIDEAKLLDFYEEIFRSNW